MGKKKSVVLMTLITIVILVFCALVAFPVVTVPGSNGIKSWNPIAMHYDLGAEFSGGHYAYYYPNGVITETEYENNLAALEGEEAEDYQASYKQYKKDGVATSLYLSTDEDDRIWSNGEVSAPFKAAFNEAVDLVSARFAARAAKTGSTYRVSVVDDFAIRVELSASEVSESMTSASYASQAFTQFANTGSLTFEMGGETVDQLTKEVTVNDLVKKVSVKKQYKIAYIKMTFTALGKEMLKDLQASEDTSATLDLKISTSDEALLQIGAAHINSKNQVEIGVQYQKESLYADTLCILINSALENGAVYIDGNEITPLTLVAPTSSEIRTYEPVYGNALIWIYVAVLAVLVALAVFGIVKMGGFGVMNVYTSLTYTIIAAICFGYITGGVFVVSLGSIFVFLAGLALTNVLHTYIYHAIKAEAKLGKTVQSSVKNGYKKTLWTVVDTYAVLLLGAIALLIGAASLNTIACQAIICIFTGAFCNIAWGRAINCMLLSASKDKYKYFHFVREDDGDDE